MNKRLQVQDVIKSIIGQSNTYDGLDNGIQFGDILTPNFLDNTPYSGAIKYDIPDGKNDLRVLTSDNPNGVIEATFLAEGAELPENKHTFKSKTIKLGKVVVMVPSTGEIDQDTYLTSFLRRKLPEAIKNAVNAAIVYGSDGTDAIGAIKGSAVTYTTSEVGIVAQIKDMYDNIAPSNNLMWVVSKTALDNIIANGFGIIEFEGKEAFIFGIPVVLGNYMSPGEILLGDFSNYAIAQKELKTDVSEHVYFDSDQNLLRTVLRIGGAVTLTAPLSAETYELSGFDFDPASGITITDLSSYDPYSINLKVTSLSGDIYQYNYTGDGVFDSDNEYLGAILSGDSIILDEGTHDVVTYNNDILIGEGISISGYDVPYDSTSLSGYLPIPDELGAVALKFYQAGGQVGELQMTLSGFPEGHPLEGNNIFETTMGAAFFVSHPVAYINRSTGTVRIIKPLNKVFDVYADVKTVDSVNVLDPDTATASVTIPVKTTEVKYPFAMNA